MRLFWPRERALSTDSDASTASQSSVASGQSFASIEADDWSEEPDSLADGPLADTLADGPPVDPPGGSRPVPLAFVDAWDGRARPGATAVARGPPRGHHDAAAAPPHQDDQDATAAAAAGVFTVYPHSSRQFDCSLCGHASQDFAALSSHRRAAHRGTPFVDRFAAGCACAAAFTTRAAAAKHATRCLTAPRAAAASRAPSPDAGAPSTTSRDGARTHPVDPALPPVLGRASPGPVATAPSPREQRAVSLFVVAPPRVAVVGDKRRRLNALDDQDHGEQDDGDDAATAPQALGAVGLAENDGPFLPLEEIDEESDREDADPLTDGSPDTGDMGTFSPNIHMPQAPLPLVSNEPPAYSAAARPAHQRSAAPTEPADPTDAHAPTTMTHQQPEPPQSAALDTAATVTVPPTPPAAGALPLSTSTRARAAHAEGGDDRRRGRGLDGAPLQMPPGLDAAATDAPAHPTRSAGTTDVDTLLDTDDDDADPATTTSETDDEPRATREETENALAALLAVLSRTAATMASASQLLATLDDPDSDHGEALTRDTPPAHGEAHSAVSAMAPSAPDEQTNSDIPQPLERDTSVAGANAPRAPAVDEPLSERPPERPPGRTSQWGPRLPTPAPTATTATTRPGSRWGPRLSTAALAQTTRARSRWGQRLSATTPPPPTCTPTRWNRCFPTSVPPMTTRTRTRWGPRLPTTESTPLARTRTRWGPRLPTTESTPLARTRTRWGPRHLHEPAPIAKGTHPPLLRCESPEDGGAVDVAMDDASTADETTAGATDIEMPNAAPGSSANDAPDDPMPAAVPEEARLRGQRGGRRRRKKGERTVKLVHADPTTAATTRRPTHDGIDRGSTTARGDESTATTTPQRPEAPAGEHHRRVEIVTADAAPSNGIDDDGEWTLRFDGACRKNPGPGGAGAALFKPSGAVVWTCFHYMPGSETNNTAEYAALLSGVESAVHHGVRRLRVEGDSHLVLSQVRGTMACTHKRLRRVRDRIQTLLKRVPTKTLVHIDRKANQHADRLANRALDLRRTEVVCGVHASDATACCHPEQPLERPFVVPADRCRAPGEEEEHKNEHNEDDDDDARSELNTDDEAEAELAARDDGHVHPALPIDAHSFPVRQPRLVLRTMTTDGYDDAAARVAEAADRLACAIEDSTDWKQGEGYICAIPAMLRTALARYTRPARPAPTPGHPRPQPRPARPPRITRHQREHRLDEALDDLATTQSTAPHDRRRMKNARRRVARVRKAQASSTLRAMFSKREKACVEQILRGDQPDGNPTATPSTCPIAGDALSAHYTGRAAARTVFDYDDSRGERFRRALGESTRELATGNEGLSDALTVDDVEDQLKHAKGNTSPGHDGIGYDIYKRFTTQLSRLLVATFGLCWRHGRVPANWKVGNVRLIYKKGDASDADNWRPICLQPAIYKLYTGLLARRLSAWLERNARLPMTQKGFRAFNGCHENNFIATTLLDQTRRRHKKLYTVWYDLKDAFGSLPQELMWRVLQDVGVAPPFIARCRSLYDGALYTVTNASDGETRPITRELGVFQGCPLSPLLFITALTPLLRQLEQLPGVGVQLAEDVRHCSAAYADDIKLYCDTRDGIARCHDTVAAFLAWTGLRANPAKCAALGITTNARSNPIIDRDFALALHGELIPLIGLHDSYNYLGVGDGFDHARHRVQLEDKITQLTRDAVTLLRSDLAPWQILKALKVYIYPRVDYALRHVRPLQAQLQGFDNAVERGVRRLLRLPATATTQLLYTPVSSGGLGLLPLTEHHAVLQTAHAWQMLHSKDPAIRAVAREQVRQVARARHKLDAAHWSGPDRLDELVEQFLNSTLSESPQAPPKRRNGDIGSLWSDTQRHLRTWGLRLEPKKDSDNDGRLHLQVPHHSKWLDHKTVLRHLKLHCKLRHRAKWAEMPDQGRTVRTHGNAGSKFLTTGGGLTEAEYRFAILARLNQLDTNAVLHRKRLRANKTCRAPGCTRAETTAHVLNHCARNMDTVRGRHDDTLKMIGRALERAHTGTGVTVQLNSTVPEYEFAALRPDIFLRDPATRSAVVADLAITFEDQPNDSASSSTLRHSHDHKVAKYKEVAEVLERHGWRVTCAALVYGSLGSVLPSNFATYTEQLGLLKRDAKKLDRALASHCIRASRRVWNWHCSQHRTRQHNRSERHGSGGNRSQPTSTTQ